MGAGAPTASTLTLTLTNQDFWITTLDLFSYVPAGDFFKKNRSIKIGQNLLQHLVNFIVQAQFLPIPKRAINVTKNDASQSKNVTKKSVS